MRILKIAAGLCAVFWAVTGTGTAAMAQSYPDGIIVTGEGTVATAPDMATIRLGVSARASSASDAMAQVSANVSGILAQLDTLDVSGADRQTSGLYLRPVYDDRPPNDADAPAEVVAYEAGNTLSVTMRSLDDLGMLLDAVISEGANNFNGLTFGLQDSADAVAQARKSAVEDAMARAEQLASAAGLTLGNIISMQESSQGYRPMEMKAAQMRSMDVPIEAGELDVRAQVTMQFDIAPTP